MLNLHQILANSALLVMLLLGIWGLIAAAIGKSVGGSYRATYVLSVGLFIAQGVVGLGLVISGHRPADFLHYLYGVVPILALGLAYSYAAKMSPRREALTFGIVCLFAVGLVIRAFSTGR